MWRYYAPLTLLLSVATLLVTQASGSDQSIDVTWRAE